MNNTLISLRNCNNQFYNAVMFEWEDDFAQKGFKVERRKKLFKLLGILIQRMIKQPYEIHQQCLSRLAYSDRNILSYNKLAFMMFVSQYRELYPHKIVPIFIDTRVDSFKIMLDAIKNIDFAIITNRSAYEKAKSIYPQKRLYSIPLWCSDKWALKEPPIKIVDVLQIGRKNSILHSFMLRFASSHPNVDYIYKEDDSEDYISTVNGNVGPLKTRQDYMTALRKAKVCLVSSPLVESAPEMDFITPRVYEAAMSYCYMLGRFTKNAEFYEIGLDRVVDLIDNYETFKSALTNYLENDQFIKRVEFDQFIRDNSFEARWEKFSQIFKL